MKIGVIYLHVLKRGYPEAPEPAYYAPFHASFRETYEQFAPGIEHELRVVCCGAEPDEATRQQYAGIKCSFDSYLEAGSDLGAQQAAMSRLDCDFIVNLASVVNFWRPGWLRRLVEARQRHGDGLYGPFASNECNPHIRTSCWAVDRATFLRYPHRIDTRQKCYWAEHQDVSGDLWQFTYWYRAQDLPTLMVTWDGEYGPSKWRKPDAIMYRGDQSNCLLHDRYTRLYQTWPEPERRAAEARIN